MLLLDHLNPILLLLPQLLIDFPLVPWKLPPLLFDNLGDVTELRLGVSLEDLFT